MSKRTYTKLKIYDKQIFTVDKIVAQRPILKYTLQTKIRLCIPLPVKDQKDIWN